MKTVFDNRQIAHVWAQQTQESGKTPNRNLFFEGKTIYSYGYHFPLARFATDDIVLVNKDSYSVSTSKHQGYVRNAITHKQQLFVSTQVLKAFADYKDSHPVLFPPAIQDIVIEEAFKDFDNGMQRAAKRRVKRCRVEDTLAAIGKLKDAAEVFETLQTPVPKKLVDAIAQYEGENSNAIETYLKDITDKEAALKAQREATYDKAKTSWLNHETPEPRIRDHITRDTVQISAWIPCHVALSYGHTLLRIAKDGQDVETSRGAKFPVEHAIKAFNVIRLLRDNKKEYEAQHDKEGGYRLGHFKIDKIDKNGNVTAGCHFVPWESIEHAARVLKIFP